MEVNGKHLCLSIMIIALSACGSSTSHCYLCEGVPCDEPCVVNLATGEIAVLSVGGYGHAELSLTGGISVTGKQGESCSALVPAIGEKVNPNLYCDDCLALIEATSNTGYVLADLGDLNSIHLYGLESGTAIKLGNYTVSVSESIEGFNEVNVAIENNVKSN